MSSQPTTDEQFISKAEQDASNARKAGTGFIIGGFLLQLLHLITIPVRGFPFMVIIAGIILVGAGILFIMGSYTVPRNREEFVQRMQKIMLDHDPDRRLWAAQRLVGYAKNANFTREQILNLAKHATTMVKDPDVKDVYKEYVAVDHIILLRELAVNVDMDKHTRKQFSNIVSPLQNLEGLSDEAYEILTDAIAYNPDKLPIQAYSDLRKQKEELE